MTTALSRRDANWRVHAACRDGNPAMFEDSERSVWPPPRAVEAAHDHCAPCPVRTICDAFADELGEVGVWAGKWRHQGAEGGEGSGLTVIDMLATSVAYVPNRPVPEGLAPRVERAWRALPPAGFTTTGRVAAAVDLDAREASRALGNLAARGLAASPTKGVWRRAIPAVCDGEAMVS